MLTKEEAVSLLGGSEQQVPESPQTPEEILEAMKAVASNYYRQAIATNCHAFIEFTGLMNEYIKVCEQNLAAGRDFTQINAHTSEQPMDFEYHNIQYINSKLECIFKGLIVLQKAD